MNEEKGKKEKESFIKKFFAWLKKIILAIIAFLFGSRKKKENIKKITLPEEQNTTKITPSITNITASPNEPPTIANPHDTANHQKNKVLKLTKEQKSKIQIYITKTKEVFTKEEIEKIIDEVIENIEEHKKQNFKVEKATTEEKENIKKLKEKIIPKINEVIIEKEIDTKEKLVQEVQNIITEEIKKNKIITITKPTIQLESSPKEPIPPKNKQELPKAKKTILNDASLKPTISTISTKSITQKDIIPYLIATPLNIPMNLAPTETKKPIINKPTNRIMKTSKEKKESIKEEIKEKPLVMVKTQENIPEPSLSEKVEKAALIGAKVFTDAAIDLISPEPERKKTLSSEEETEKISAPDDSLLKKNELDLEQKPDLKKLEKITEEIEYVAQKAEDKEDEIKRKEKKAQEKKEKQSKEKKPTINEKEKMATIAKSEVEIATITANAIEIEKDIEHENTKEDIEEKNYKDIQDKIDKMLNNIESTRLKYDKKLNESQIRKLDVQEIRLRNSRQNIDAQMKIDIENEKRELLATISENDKKGLNEEIQKLQIEHQLEVNKEVLGNIQKLDSMSKKNASIIEKKLIKRKLHRASLAAEVTSLLSLPFIHNKYFLYLTAGLVVGNHLNFINAIIKRKEVEPSELDLESIKHGEDALNGAINETYNNLDKLAIIKQQIISKYPEMKYDHDFISTTNNLEYKLNKSYQKLNSKKTTMEKYMNLSKTQIKILKKVKK